MLGNVVAQVIVEDSPKKRLRQIIVEESLLTNQSFTLSSGKNSNFFVNLKQTMLHPEGSNILADLVLEKLEELDIHCIGGLEMGAVPLVASVCTKSFPHFSLDAFFVRKQPKGHGAKELIDGHLKPKSEVLVIDDVVTTGRSVLDAVKAVRARGCHVSKILAIVDRQEGGRENLAKEGCELISLLERSDFPGIDD